MTPELAAYLRTLPDRCPECLASFPGQRHALGCSILADAPPSAVEVLPTLPPLAWTAGLTCDCWRDDLGRVCGATEGVRHYLTGTRCPDHTPEAIRRRA